MVATLGKDWLAETFPMAGPDMLRLLRGAADESGLYPSDFYTIRDLTELAGCEECETLPALLLALLLALEEGSLCVQVAAPSLARRFTDVVGDEQARTWAERILHDLAAGAFAALIDDAPGGDKPVVRVCRQERCFLYFQKFYGHERAFREAWSRRMQADQAAAPPCDAILHEVLVEQPLLLGDQPLKLDPFQQAALERALSQSQLVISGGPGTGKTSLVLTLLRCLLRLGVAPEQIALAAPTGRAAQRLGDAIRTGLDRLPKARVSGCPDARLDQLTASTLHQLLQYSPKWGDFHRHGENPIAAEVVIVDEVSMVGVELMARLLEALPPTAKLILLGDKDQLPSVDAGAVLASLVAGVERQAEDSGQRVGGHPPVSPSHQPVPAAGCPLPTAPVVLLQQNHRSEEHIRAAAAAINVQDFTLVDRLERLPERQPESTANGGVCAGLGRGGCWLWEPPSRQLHGLRNLLHDWATNLYLTARGADGAFCDLVKDVVLTPGAEDDPRCRSQLQTLFDLLDQGRILTVVREGSWGCVEVNRLLATLLRPHLDRRSRGEFFAGAPVLITRNDHTRQLYNGDVGLALRGPGGGLRVVFPRRAGFAAFPADALPSHELGFALTVHKSQGSEYDQVLLLLPPEGGRKLLTKEILYTGITRGKNQAVIAASAEVLRYAIGRKIVRETGQTW